MIDNISYTETDYKSKKEEILQNKQSFDSIYNHIRKRGARNFASENVVGNYIVKSTNIENGSWLVNIHSSRNVVVANGDK